METWLIILTAIAAIFLIVRKLIKLNKETNKSDSDSMEDVIEDIGDIFFGD